MFVLSQIGNELPSLEWHICRASLKRQFQILSPSIVKDKDQKIR